MSPFKIVFPKQWFIILLTFNTSISMTYSMLSYTKNLLYSRSRVRVILTYIHCQQIAIRKLDFIMWNYWRNIAQKRRQIFKDVWPMPRLKARWTAYSLGSYDPSWSEGAWMTVACAHCHYSHRLVQYILWYKCTK